MTIYTHKVLLLSLFAQLVEHNSATYLTSKQIISVIHNLSSCTTNSPAPPTAAAAAPINTLLALAQLEPGSAIPTSGKTTDEPL